MVKLGTINQMKFKHQNSVKNRVRNAVRSAELKIYLSKLCIMSTSWKAYKHWFLRGFHNAVRNAGVILYKNVLQSHKITSINTDLQDFFVMQFIMQNFVVQIFDSALRVRSVKLINSCMWGFFIMQIHCTTKCITEMSGIKHRYWLTVLFHNADFSYIYINIYACIFKMHAGSIYFTAALKNYKI